MIRSISAMLFILLYTAPIKAQDNIDKALLMDYFQEQQFDKAIQYLEGVKPQQANGLALLASAYYQSGQLLQAEKNYTLVLERDSNYIQAHQALGNIRRQQKLPKAALAHFEKLVALRPTNPLYYKQLSEICDAIVGLQDSAFNYMWQAYQLNPKDASVVISLSSDFVDKKEHGRADSLLKQYMLTDSTHPRIIASLVKVSCLQKDYVSATIFGKRLLDMEAVDSQAWSYLAAAYYTLKKYDSCIYVHDRMRAATGGNAPESIVYYAGIAYGRLKQYDKSNELIQECIRMAKSQELDNYYATLADNYEQMKEFKRAIAYYDTSYFLSKDPMRQYGIGRIYETYLQDPLNAKKHYKKYVEFAKPLNKEEISIHTYVKERIKNL